MAKTKAMCIINRSTKLIGIQHEKKHGKGSKNSSTYFDNRIEIEQESDILIADCSFDECSNFKDGVLIVKRVILPCKASYLR